MVSHRGSIRQTCCIQPARMPEHLSALYLTPRYTEEEALNRRILGWSSAALAELHVRRCSRDEYAVILIDTTKRSKSEQTETGTTSVRSLPSEEDTVYVFTIHAIAATSHHRCGIFERFISSAKVTPTSYQAMAIKRNKRVQTASTGACPV
jgi:hypothetical protein